MTTRVLPLVLAVSLASTACVPPTRLGFGGGGAAGDVAARNSGNNVRTGSTAALGELRFAIAPLALGDGLGRRHDLSLGWTLDWTSIGDRARGFRHGPYLEGAWFARQWPSESGRDRWRLGPTAAVELHVAADRDDGPDAGYGATIGVLAEYANAVRPSREGAHGDLGVGVAARIGVRREDGGTAGVLLLSLEVRIPGLLVIPLPSKVARQMTPQLNR